MITLLLGCGGGDAPPAAPPPGRFDAVIADPSKVPTPEAFCDQYATADAAKPFPVPPLDAGAMPADGRWHWVNVWATWCAPCVAEMPRLVQWRDRLAKEGRAVDLVLVSADAGASDVSRFYDRHPDWPPTLRIASADALPPWLQQLGLGEATAIPLHVFVDPEGKLRCIRSGGLGDEDYDAVKRVLGGG